MKGLLKSFPLEIVLHHKRDFNSLYSKAIVRDGFGSNVPNVVRDGPDTGAGRAESDNRLVHTTLHSTYSTFEQNERSHYKIYPIYTTYVDMPFYT